jgi:hypothetical protein
MQVGFILNSIFKGSCYFNTQRLKMDLRVGKNWQLMKKIGSGAFGEIYEGITT